MIYLVAGKVIKGDGYGRKLGFPTANLDTPRAVLPSDGVYSGEVEVDGKKYRAGIVIGPNNKVEAHLINFNADIYGKIIVVEIHKFLREYKNFNNEEELKEQIKKDIEQC